MKVLVTGSAGFIGMHVARLLLQRGDEVVGIDNLNDYYDPRLKAARLGCLEPFTNFRFVRMDVADSLAIADLFASERFDRVIHLAKDGRRLFVTVRVSPSEFSGQKVLLVTTSDITKRLETEQQLIQASKMATLGEMATGVAHELNQPLTVIKTASSFFMKKIGRGERIDDQVLSVMAREIDGYVDRAVKIINHLREFGRRSDATRDRVRLNDVLRSAFDLFSRQRVRIAPPDEVVEDDCQ